MSDAITNDCTFKGTPGEWHSVYEASCDNSVGLVFANIGGKTHIIAEDTNQANVQLMSASKELLEALILAWDVLSGYTSNLEKAREKFESATAKALGRM